ncbi:acetyltransferase [Flavobacterium sp. B183]|uniref:acetyltransferase n=1 Tax=Flavobacterium sp. B183 TaxID=907046 RepID=UPI00201F14F1|nr:acetyltransferase [Flavobacterium sp. B183]URC13086.1 acetyltransferase [Flavobacterium sp. B183]
MYDKFSALGGIFTSTISPLSNIGNFGNEIELGCNIMTGTVITSDVTIKKGSLVNLNCTIGHDSILGEFVELSPGVSISGNCIIGTYSLLGTNSTVLPKVTIGKNVIVGAGAVVTKDIPDNSMVVGIPGKIIKELKPLEFF